MFRATHRNRLALPVLSATNGGPECPLYIPRSVSQRLSCFQRVLNSFLCLALTTKGLERLALEVQDVLLADRGTRGDVPAAQHFSNLAGDFHLVIADVLALSHEVYAQLEHSQNILAGSGNIVARLWRLVPGASEVEGALLGIGKNAFAIHSDLVGVV